MALLGWQMAKQWLLATGVIPPGSKINLPECDVFDFAHSLRDGVILCQVANFLRDGAVRDVNLATHMSQFLCMKNIRGFLKACTSVFGISKEQLFSANDLYDVSDFQKVIHTLSLLSKTSQAQSKRLEAFPTDNHSHHEDDGEGIYSKLSDVISEKQHIEDELDSIYVTRGIQENERIYEDLIECNAKVRRRHDVSTTHAVDKRSHVINELLQTEENYYQALKVMIECFITPLRQLLTPDEKSIMFINTESLYQFHGEFLRALRLHPSDRTTDRTADRTIDISSFVKYKMRFLEYGLYCSRVRDAQEFVTEKTRNQSFNSKVEECQQKSGRKFPLQEQLIVPFQRILKYPLLLKELRKQTPADHRDKEQIDKALMAMEDVGKYVNHYKKDDDERRTVDSIANSVHDDVGNAHLRINEFGRRIRDGDLNVKFSNNDRKKRYAFLFETTLLLCKTRGETYIVKENLPLRKFKLESEISSTVKGIRPTLAWSLEAQVPDGATEANNCIMIAKSPQDKEKWVEDIQRCIDFVTLAKLKKIVDKHQFELTTFTSGKACSVCELLLCGQITQGYKCDNCQKTVHYDCIEKCPQCVSRRVQMRREQQGRSYEGTHMGNRSPSTTPRPAVRDLQEQLKRYPWFVGERSRDEAEGLLQAEPDGTFLVRVSARSGQFALSVKYRSDIKHIVIEIKEGMYYLSEAKRFFSMPEMVDYYKRNSLETSFPTLPTMLLRPVTDSNEAQLWVRAMYPYNTENPDELSLMTEDRIMVTKAEGNWWYGECRGRSGYFPSNYVEKIANDGVV